MSHTLVRCFVRCLVGPLCVVFLAATACAAEGIDGSDFSLKVPPGFRALPSNTPPDDCGG